jgi:hypothetical protein
MFGGGSDEVRSAKRRHNLIGHDGDDGLIRSFQRCKRAVVAILTILHSAAPLALALPPEWCHRSLRGRLLIVVGT